MDAISQTDIIKCIFLNENVRIPIKISLKIVPKGPNNKFSSIGSDNGLVTRHYLKQCWLVYRRIYASLGLNELTLIWHMWGRSCPMKDKN